MKPTKPSTLLLATFTCTFILFCTSGSCGQEFLLIDDFEDISDWQQNESRGSGAVVVQNVQVELKSHRDNTRPGAFLRIVDRSSTDHWFWLHKRKDDGWDLSRARAIVVWARNDGPPTMLRFLAKDDRGNSAYYALGPLGNKDWERKSLDLNRELPFAKEGTVDWGRIVLIGLRADAAHHYTIDFDELTVEFGDARTFSMQEIEREGARHDVTSNLAQTFLAPVSSGDLNDSFVGVNLMGVEDVKEFDLLARAGVKWAKLGGVVSGDFFRRTDYMVKELRKRNIHVIGHLPQTVRWTPKLYPDVKDKEGESIPIIYSQKAMDWYKQALREAAEHFRGRIHVWEVGNEPDIAEFWKPTPDPDAFGRFVIETSKILKSVNPDNKVISGGVCGFWSADFVVARDFLTAFFSTGAGAHIDYLGLHSYRAHPELGAPNLSQRQVAEAVHKLAAGFGCSLPLWDTEWQSTPVVNRTEVPYATDLYQAKSMLRKYLIAADAGFTHMNWQICKATAQTDHPGQIFTKDGLPTSKYVALSHVGALFSKIAAPAQIEVKPVKPQLGGAVRLLKRGDFDDPSSLQEWKIPRAGTCVMIDDSTPYRGRGALRLSSPNAICIDTARRWQPVVGASIIEVGCVLKGNDCTITFNLTPRDDLGHELPPPELGKRPLVARQEFRTVCLRFTVEGAWHDIGLRIELPSGGTVLIDELDFLYHVPPPEIVTFAFKLKGSQWPAVFYWMPSKPSDGYLSRSVDIAAKPFPAAEYILLDTLTGECHTLPVPQSDGEEMIFQDMPLCDYPMGIIPNGIMRTTSTPTWFGLFAGPDELVDRTFTDRTDDFYLRGFWSVVGALAERAAPDVTDERLRALQLMRRFWQNFSTPPKEIAVKPSGQVRLTLRPRPGEWRDSVANPTSQHVNRYFYELDDADRQATVHEVRMAGRVLPQRPWADSPQNAYTWFTILRKAQPTEVFVVVPEGMAFDGRDCEIDLSLLPRAKALLLSDPTGKVQCIAYWTEPLMCAGETRYVLQLQDDTIWFGSAMLIDPRTTRSCGEVFLKKAAQTGHVTLNLPPSPHPMLVVPHDSLQYVRDALGPKKE